MKIILRIIVVLAVLLLIAYCSDQSVKENDMLKAPTSPERPLPSSVQPVLNNTNTVAKPESGISIYVGKNTNDLVKDFGHPDRIDTSAYGFEWWVYNQSFSTYMMVGVKSGIINQIYAGGSQLKVTPYEIGQSVDDIYRFSIIESEISVQIGSNIYIFSLNEQDIKNRMLISYDGLYAQLYIDDKDKELVAVRFIEPTTLVLQKPYDMMYSGNWVAPDFPSSDLQVAIDLANERQLLDVTNLYRVKHEIQQLQYEPLVSIAARLHSEDMARKNYFSHESPDFGSLADRMTKARIEYKTVGENIASNYVDAAEAVHGWLNSEEHRKVLLSDEFTHLGLGVFGKYYTQNFLQREEVQPDEFEY